MPHPNEHAAFYRDAAVTVHHGDSLAVLRTLPDNSLDSVVTDPPYGLSKEPDISEVLTHWLAGDDYIHTGGGFMGREWDSFVPGPSVWREAYRVLKPGGHALIFSATRTYDLMTIALRMAGFEVRDSIHWVYGQGWPKSMDLPKALTKTKDATGADIDRWTGWGTALKPAHEMITLVRKPLDGTVANNVLTHGVGALNIDGARIKGNEPVSAEEAAKRSRTGEASADRRYTTTGSTNFAATPGPRGGDPAGRFPTNMVLTHHPDCVTDPHPGPVRPVTGEGYGGQVQTVRDPYQPTSCVPGCPAKVMDDQSGTLKSGANNRVRGGVNHGAAYGAESRQAGTELIAYGDEGGASRFFPRFHPSDPVDLFTAAQQDPAAAANDAACPVEDTGWDEPMLPVQTGDYAPFMYAKKAKGGTERLTVYVPDPGCRPDGDRACGPDPHHPDTNPNDAASATPRDCDQCGTAWVTYQHPTVKPLGGTNGDGLMPWLISLVTPKDGTTLDLYAGTGTTGLAAARNGYASILIERDPVHVFMIRQRLLDAAEPGPMKRARAAEKAAKPAKTAQATTADRAPGHTWGCVLVPDSPADDTPDLFTLLSSEDPAA